MSTSGETAWVMTARDIVKHAMLELGVIAPNEEPDAAEMDACIVRLNGLLKSWSTAGGLSFLEGTDTITIPAATSSVALPANVRSVGSARVVDSATNHRAMAAFNRSQYMALPNKVAVGSPSIFYVSDGGDSATLHVWPVPSTETDILIDFGGVIQTIVDPSEEVNAPQEWHEALYLNLASRIAGIFGATRIDPGTVQDVQQRANRLYGQLLDAERPDSYLFEPYDGY